ncbi:hypothetical protein ACFZDJ_34145 [Streptomyces sp. NPDC007896]|uniref:hypothetical protein n=1 Tax=Streptomyces sp. NPDC007896 TaxID=3364784 RepID=UPI0036F0AD4D
MWLGQAPGGEQNSHSQNVHQRRNPHQQPGWPPGGGGGKRAKAVAIAAATVVVMAAGVTGFLLLSGGRDDNADSGGKNAKASASASRSATASASGSPLGGGAAERPTIPGWKVVVNPKWGTAFDVPPGWDVKGPDTLIGFDDSKVDYNNPENWGKTVIVMSAPAVLRENWCLSDDGNEGRVDGTALAAAGTKGAKGAKSTADAALSQVGWWVYGGYTQPDKKSIIDDEVAKPYTTKSGVKGSIARARSRNTPQKGKCATDGKAMTFGFTNSAGDFVAWNLYGATGVKDELPDSTIMKILSTVRLHGNPTGS